MINLNIIEGYITKDIELRKTKNDNDYAVFYLGVRGNRKDENDNYKTEFLKVIAYNKLAVNLARFVGKGSLLSVVGYNQVDEKDIVTHDNKTVRVRDIYIVANEINFLKTNKPEETITDIIDTIQDKGRE